MILQHTIVLLLLALSVAMICRGIVRTLSQKQGGIGKCCERGCDPSATSTQAPANPKVVFIPVSTLRKK
ncbi:MAG TPA: hypothetical protein VGB55_14400 [Tepidisphaeraceae bacterium]